MNTEANLDIEVAVVKDLKSKPAPSQPLETSKDGLHEIKRQLQQRRNNILQKRQDDQLRDPEILMQARQQERIKLKVPIFTKYATVIQDELKILQMEISDLNEWHQTRSNLFTIYGHGHWSAKDKLKDFEHNLRLVRRSTCLFKYANNGNTFETVCFWMSCWCFMPIICCFNGCLAESTAHKRLRETYEKQEAMMVQENKAVALPVD